MKSDGKYHIHIVGPKLDFHTAIDDRADMVLAENVIEYVMQRVRAEVLTSKEPEQSLQDDITKPA